MTRGYKTVNFLFMKRNDSPKYDCQHYLFKTFQKEPFTSRELIILMFCNSPEDIFYIKFRQKRRRGVKIIKVFAKKLNNCAGA